MNQKFKKDALVQVNLSGSSKLGQIIDVVGDDAMVRMRGGVSIIDIENLNEIKIASRAQKRRLEGQLKR
jgi:hypothetical protein